MIRAAFEQGPLDGRTVDLPDMRPVEVRQVRPVAPRSTAPDEPIEMEYVWYVPVRSSRGTPRINNRGEVRFRPEPGPRRSQREAERHAEA